MLAKIILVISLVLALPAGVLAEAVGRLTKVEGRVEILKGGKLPPATAQAQDGIKPKDIVRTKSLSRAQITFLDNTTVTLSPDSRFAVEEYSFDAAQGKRGAVMQLFQGLAYFVVSQVFKAPQPDFIVKTHTAVMGVRGTEVGLRLTPNESTFLNFKGLVRVGNIFPEVGAGFKGAEKIAFSFGNKFVDLKEMEGCVVPWDLPPTLPFRIFKEDRELFMRQLLAGLGRQAASSLREPGPVSQVANLPAIVSPAVIDRMEAVFNNITIPPTLVRPTPVSPTESFTFSQTFSSGSFSLITGPLMTTGVFDGILTASRTVAYPGTFRVTFNNLTAVTSPLTPVFPSTGDSGTFSVLSNTVNVSGRPGGVLVGNMTLTAQAVGSFSTTTFSLTGPVAISPGGGLLFRPGGTFTIVNAGGGASGNITAGNWVQTSLAAAILRPGATVQPPAAVIPASQPQMLGPALVKPPTTH
jgi:hypothetical protein